MAEIEIGVLALQCLERRIPDRQTLRGEVEAWQKSRNRDAVRVNWRFTTEDARIKLRSICPSIQTCRTTGSGYPSSLKPPNMEILVKLPENQQPSQVGHDIAAISEGWRPQPGAGEEVASAIMRSASRSDAFSEDKRAFRSFVTTRIMRI